MYVACRCLGLLFSWSSSVVACWLFGLQGFSACGRLDQLVTILFQNCSPQEVWPASFHFTLWLSYFLILSHPFEKLLYFTGSCWGIPSVGFCSDNASRNLWNDNWISDFLSLQNSTRCNSSCFGYFLSQLDSEWNHLACRSNACCPKVWIHSN